ncbi:MAG: HEAT repeat domain-containing protein [Planctomycetes bacterium]|nr:HEAT repeat domain-containing protein [Planctomycetota bacterium]
MIVYACDSCGLLITREEIEVEGLTLDGESVLCKVCAVSPVNEESQEHSQSAPRREKRKTEPLIWFCDVCERSITLADFMKGEAIKSGESVYCDVHLPAGEKKQRMVATITCDECGAAISQNALKSGAARIHEGRVLCFKHSRDSGNGSFENNSVVVVTTDDEESEEASHGRIEEHADEDVRGPGVEHSQDVASIVIPEPPELPPLDFGIEDEHHRSPKHRRNGRKSRMLQIGLREALIIGAFMLLSPMALHFLAIGFVVSREKDSSGVANQNPDSDGGVPENVEELVGRTTPPVFWDVLNPPGEQSEPSTSRASDVSAAGVIAPLGPSGASSHTVAEEIFTQWRDSRRLSGFSEIEAALASENEDEQLVALFELARIGDRDHHRLATKFLGSENPTLRLAAINVCVALRATEASWAISRLLSDPDERIRKSAQDAVVQLELFRRQENLSDAPG